MKKAYINPEMEIVKIQTTGMLATSGGVTDGSPLGDEFTPGDQSFAPELPGIPPFVFEFE
ncbi:MAG: hypothetical protein IJS95_05160 [Prevotella sp.]|nr:hypothetical protein [Prevotella sp.]